MAQRTDPHRPGAINPGDYEYVGYIYAHPGDDYFEDFEEERLAELMGRDPAEEMDPDAVPWGGREWDGQPGRAGRQYGCAHCGQTNIVHWYFYWHAPTGTVIEIGHDCAGLMGVDTREAMLALKKGKAAKKAAEQEAAAAKRRAAYEADEEGVRIIAILEGVRGTEKEQGFIGEMVAALDRYGSLTEGQAAAVLRFEEQEAQRAEQAKLPQLLEEVPEEKTAIADELLAGRTRIKGRLLAVKESESTFGVTVRMTVADERGFRTNGTIPAGILQEMFEIPTEVDYERAWGRNPGEVQALAAALHHRVRVTVEFDAALELPHDGDGTFVFTKRPTKPALTVEEA